jgi:hypothetical protein
VCACGVRVVREAVERRAPRSGVGAYEGSERARVKCDGGSYGYAPR